MDDSEMKLDGNALAGLLADVLVEDATQVRARCASCGAKGEIGAQSLYMFRGSPGAVLRCHLCGAILMVLVRAQGRVRIGLPGATWLDLAEGTIPRPEAATV